MIASNGLPWRLLNCASCVFCTRPGCEIGTKAEAPYVLPWAAVASNHVLQASQGAVPLQTDTYSALGPGHLRDLDLLWLMFLGWFSMATSPRSHR